MKVSQECKDALDKAKLTLMSKPESVYLTSILFSVRWNWEPVGTACTTYKRIIIDPRFFMNMTDPERVGLICHEVGHIMFKHNTRRGERHPVIWNWAGDFVINDMLLNSGFELPGPKVTIQKLLDQDVPDGTVGMCLYDPSLKGMSTEEVYDLLCVKLDYEENSEEFISLLELLKGLNDIGSEEDEELENLGIELDENEFNEPEVDNIIIRAYQEQELIDNIGSLPDEVIRLVDEILDPQVPWQIHLNEFLQPLAQLNYSYKRPSKKYLPDVIMPTLVSEKLKRFLGFVDSSGSVKDPDFQIFLTECEGIRYLLTPEETRIYSFNIQLVQEKIFEEHESLLDTLFHGGGGTSIVPVIDKIKELEPEVAIIFTDGRFYPYTGHPPDCPVVWLIKGNENFNCDFGKIIHYR